MLTFRFTGASGEMTEGDLLTAGMEGKQVRLEFSPEWDGLRKAVVFAAGSRSCTIVDAGETETIPAQILSESLRRLYVGAYGLSEEGMVVIPAHYATGPFIHIGTGTSGDDSDYVPEDPFWLEVEENLSKTLRFTPQELSEGEKQLARQNIGALAENPEAAKLLSIILKNGVYTTDQYENILHLTVALCGGEVFGISAELDHVSMDNSIRLVLMGDRYEALLTPEKGYVLDAVTVTMDGEDVTGFVYTDGMLTIPEVTGDVVIRAAAVEEATLKVDCLAKGSVSFAGEAGMMLNATTVWRAMLLPVGQYLKNGKTYRFGLKAHSETYAYGLMILVASEPDLTFPYVADTGTYYPSVTARPVDSGWLQTDYTYTAAEDNLIVAINFKRMDGNPLEDVDYRILEENLILEEVQ